MADDDDNAHAAIDSVMRPEAQWRHVLVTTHRTYRDHPLFNGIGEAYTHSRAFPSKNDLRLVGRFREAMGDCDDDDENTPVQEVIRLWDAWLGAVRWQGAEALWSEKTAKVFEETYTGLDNHLPEWKRRRLSFASVSQWHELTKEEFAELRPPYKITYVTSFTD